MVTNYLLLAFAVAISFSLAWPVPGRAVAAPQVASVRIVQAINTFVVFLISGLTLRPKEVKTAFKHWPGAAYGLVAILGITPCLGFAARQVHLRPVEFGTGLAIFCVVPTTLGVGVALTAAANGNQALALFLTVTTNFLAIATIPFILQAVLSGTGPVKVDPVNLVIKLLITVVAPTAMGLCTCAASQRTAAWVQRNKVALGMLSHTSLAMIIWQTLSAARNALLAQTFIRFLLILIASVLQHVIYICFNTIAVLLLRLPAKEAIAALIMSSQKSAPVAVAVISYLSQEPAIQGLLSLPAIIGQIVQIFIGSGLVVGLRRLVKEPQE